MSQIKIEVAIEVLSLCLAKSLYENDEAELHRLNELKEKLYKSDASTIELVLKEYGNKIKDMSVKEMDLSDVIKIKQKYALTQEELEEMYLKVHLLTFQGVEAASDKPIAIVIGGQPGAGKSGLVIKSKNEFNIMKKEAILLDLDLYRGLYKNSIEIAKNYPTLYTEITNIASGKIMEKISETVIKEGYNFIFEGTMGKSIYYNK